MQALTLHATVFEQHMLGWAATLPSASHVEEISKFTFAFLTSDGTFRRLAPCWTLLALAIIVLLEGICRTCAAADAQSCPARRATAQLMGRKLPRRDLKPRVGDVKACVSKRSVDHGSVPSLYHFLICKFCKERGSFCIGQCKIPKVEENTLSHCLLQNSRREADSLVA